MSKYVSAACCINAAVGVNMFYMYVGAGADIDVGGSLKPVLLLNLLEV